MKTDKYIESDENYESNSVKMLAWVLIFCIIEVAAIVTILMVV